jgi:hypothetical protein
MMTRRQRRETTIPFPKGKEKSPPTTIITVIIIIIESREITGHITIIGRVIPLLLSTFNNNPFNL